MESLTAVAIVGGGANIPAVGAQLAQRLRVPVITAPQPGYIAATGAAMAARQRPEPDTTAYTEADTPTSMAPTAWAAGAAASESSADGDESATFRALAWSQDDFGADEPVPYSGADYTATSTAPADAGTGTLDQPGPLPWYRRPVVLFGLAAALALAATGGLVYTLTGSNSPTGHTTGVTTPSQQPTTPDTTVVTAPDGGTSVSTIPPSAPDSITAPPPTTTAEPTSTTQPATTPPPTTTEPPTTTTEPPTTQPSTSAAPPSTTAAPTETTRKRWFQPPRKRDRDGASGYS